ncbi:ABC transporter permease [Alsobacter sp. SYSU M60028]|uniref:ABC transporter permease n=1 Tax=Alsobacter ponti TaxID=2962936 RepID=A0ABT1LA10_9HYPH|nr:ABC transporter permease [Alsobacter ponti]MCP8937580.1 ABC transporter permease [Alsobacter ponti]
MLRFLVQRLATIPLVAIGVITILFVIFKSVPGDEATLAAGATSTQAEIEAMRVRLGLDRPLLIQYAGHIWGLLHLDLGYSSTFRGNPLPAILERIPATLLLMSSAIAVTVAIGIPAGLVAGANQNRWPDYAISGGVVALLAIPNFWLGMVLIAVLSVQMRWLPSFGAAGAASLVIPTIALSARLIALVARTTRGMVVEEMRKDYVRTARAKGLRWKAVLSRHVLRNVLIPIVTVIGLQAGYLLGGSVVVERLFAWPGLGDLMLTGVSVRDYTLIQGATLFFVVGFLVINLAVDILYRFINPRLRHG